MRQPHWKVMSVHATTTWRGMTWWSLSNCGYKYVCPRAICIRNVVFKNFSPYSTPKLFRAPLSPCTLSRVLHTQPHPWTPTNGSAGHKFTQSAACIHSWTPVDSSKISHRSCRSWKEKGRHVGSCLNERELAGSGTDSSGTLSEIQERAGCGKRSRERAVQEGHSH